MYKIIAASYISFIVGLAANSVGEIPTCSNEPISWWLPISMLLMLGNVAWLMYMAGKEDG